MTTEAESQSEKACEPGVVAFEDMLSEADRAEAVTLARSVFGSAEVGDRNLLAIWGLEQSATIERHEREADEGEKELQRLRLEVAIANGRAAKLRAAILEGATDFAQARAMRIALDALGTDPVSDLGPKAAWLASAFLATLEKLKWTEGVILAARAALAEGRPE